MTGEGAGDKTLSMNGKGKFHRRVSILYKEKD